MFTIIIINSIYKAQNLLKNSERTKNKKNTQDSLMCDYSVSETTTENLTCSFSQIYSWNKGGLKLFLFQEYRPISVILPLTLPAVGLQHWWHHNNTTWRSMVESRCWIRIKLHQTHLKRSVILSHLFERYPFDSLTRYYLIYAHSNDGTLTKLYNKIV